MRTSAGERRILVMDTLPRKMMNNNIFIRIDEKEGDGRSISKKVDIVSSGAEWNEADHVIRHGVVEMIPNRLVFRNDSNGDSDGMMEWGTELEVGVGDTVFFGIMASANALMIEVEGQLYYVIPYSRLIARVMDDVYPLNGYVLMEEVIESKRVKGLILDFGDKANRKRGLVLHNGRNNEWYYGGDSVDAEVEVGDEVLFQGKFYGYLESDLFRVLPKGIGYAQKLWINAKLN
jgi:co-chaperonin GroES (HSP10)